MTGLRCRGHVIERLVMSSLKRVPSGEVTHLGGISNWILPFGFHCWGFTKKYYKLDHQKISAKMHKMRDRHVPALTTFIVTLPAVTFANIPVYNELQCNLEVTAKTCECCYIVFVQKT